MRLSALARAHPDAFTALGLCAIAVVGIIDYITPQEIAFAIFYVFPIALVTWHVGMKRGLLASLVSTVVWRVANLPLHYTHPETFYWNAGAKLAFFVIICLLLTKLKSAQTLLQQANARLLDVQEREQERLGKQLREEVGQEVEGVSDLLGNLLPHVGDSSIEGSLADIATRCRKVIADVSHMSHALCPEILRTQGLVAAIREAAKAWEMPALKIEFTCQPEIENARFGTDVELTLFRIAQEAVSTAAGHAGVETIQLELTSFGAWVMLTVMDDGLTLDEQQSPDVAFAMGVMKGRIEAVGGEFKATSPPGQLRIEAKVRWKKLIVHQKTAAISA
jgi:signal transduction histidine kinase